MELACGNVRQKRSLKKKAGWSLRRRTAIMNPRRSKLKVASKVQSYEKALGFLLGTLETMAFRLEHTMSKGR